MQNKFFRFFFVEGQFRLKSGLFFIFLFIIGLQFQILQIEERQLAKLRAQKNLVMRIKEMEKVVEVNTVRTLLGKKPHVPIAGIKYHLTGTSITDSVPYAIIDDLIYTEGDTIGEYTVVKIAKDSAVLESRLTKKVKKLSFRK